MKRSTLFLTAALAATALLYTAATYSVGSDSPRRDESGFLGNLEVGQTVILANRESGFFAIYVERGHVPVLESNQTKKLIGAFPLDPRRVTKVTESYIELRGKDSQDMTRPEGFENAIVIPRHAILSIAYYSPEQPAQERIAIADVYHRVLVETTHPCLRRVWCRADGGQGWYTELCFNGILCGRHARVPV